MSSSKNSSLLGAYWTGLPDGGRSSAAEAAALRAGTRSRTHRAVVRSNARAAFYALSHDAMTAQSLLPVTSATIHGSICRCR